MIKETILNHIECAKKLNAQINELEFVCENVESSINSGGTLFLAGNGGSAADAQHIAAEFTGRFVKERKSLPAIALTTDTSALTAIGNDYGFDRIFSRQLEGLGRNGDLLIVISTSGNSVNLIEACNQAAKMGIKTIGLLGKTGGKLKDIVDKAIIVPSDVTARIQEMHILIGHIICEYIDEKF